MYIMENNDNGIGATSAFVLFNLLDVQSPTSRAESFSFQSILEETGSFMINLIDKFCTHPC